MSYVFEDRLQKLEEMRRRGIEPYAYSYRVTHSSEEARRLFEGSDPENGPAVRVAGRITSLRAHGKTTFAHLADRAGRIQLYFRRDELGDDAYAVISLLDIGDWVGVEGSLFLTKTGEITIRAAAFEVLAKSLRPLPIGKEEVDEATGERIVHHGFTDLEQRYRQRYADLAVNPDVRGVFYKRTRLITALRQYLDATDDGHRSSFRLRRHTFGGRGLQAGLDEHDWAAVRERAYEGRGG